MSFTMSGAGEVKWDFNRFDKYEEQLAEKASCGYQKGGEVKKGCDKCDGKGCEHCEGKKDAKKGEKKAKSGGSKPDYLDFDKDGDKEEPMTDALGEGVLDAALKGDKELAKLQKKADKDGKRAAKGLKFKEEAALGEGVLDAALEGDKKLGELQKKADKDGKRAANGLKFKEEASDIQYPTGEKKKFTKDKSDPKVAAGRKAAKEMGLLKKEHLELFSAEEIEALGLSAE